MEADLLPEGFFLSPALLARMAEQLPPPSQDHSDHMTGLRAVPKLEENADLDLPIAAVETPADGDCISWKRLPPVSHSSLSLVQSLNLAEIPSLPLSGDSTSGLDSVAVPSHKRLRSFATASSSTYAFPFPSPVPLPSSPALPLPSGTAVEQRSQLLGARATPRQLVPQNKQSRTRRKGISERMRMLAKLMPWERKMSTSTMLEEARSYVKFLEAQVAVLQRMPAESRFGCPPPSSYASAAAAALRGLERLTRQQLLHVLVRSPLVQDKLCGRGLCVFATEQVALMRQAAEGKRALLQQQQQQMMTTTTVDGGSSSTISD